MGRPVPVASGEVVHAQSTSSLSASAKHDGGIHQLATSSIVRSPFQPRREFGQNAIDTLSDSILRSGLMQPIIVRPGTSPGTFELVAGERRWRAAGQAGLATVPAIVRELTDEQSAEWALVENVQREDLNPMERAAAFRLLMDRFGLTHAQVAERVGMDRTTVTNTTRLLELEEAIRLMIGAGRLSAGHGRALLMAPPGPSRIDLAQRASDEYWSVRRLERAAGEMAQGDGGGAAAGAVTPAAEARAASREALEKGLGAHLGTKVSIATDRSGKRGRLVIEFYGLDHLDGLLSKFGYSG
ncbi:MAG: ParB/RepB/Spo0J family partition protein [Phycisphaerales bacterium]